MRLLFFLYVSILGIIPWKGAFLEQITPRDSILIADQLRYGFELDSIENGTGISLPDYSKILGDTLVLVDNWKLDTLKQKRKTPFLKIRAHIVVSPFEAGKYMLPPLGVVLSKPSGETDTLEFEQMEMDVCTIQVDTSTFIIHDIKGQMRYPVTFREIAPYVILVIVLAALIVLAVYLIRKYRKKAAGESENRDPAYIVALRRLEQYRGEKYWVPEKQKSFYSGITETLRDYVADRFGVDAREMTTAEIFAELKGNKELTPELWAEAKELFELADFVKFAKHTATDDDNARAIPQAVRFVMGTYKEEEPEPEANGAEGTQEK